MLFNSIDAANIRHAPEESPFPLSAIRKRKRLIGNAMHVNDVCRMVKRRMKDAGLQFVATPFPGGNHGADLARIRGLSFRN